VKKQIHDRFGLSISNQIQLQFIHLHQYRYFLQPIPFLSLLLESFGAMCLAYIGLYRSLFPSAHRNHHHPQSSSSSSYLLPDLFIDTTGCALTYLPAKILFGCQILAYVHYPTISTDMLQLVWERRRTGTYNHQSYISQSFITTYIKLLYYLLFAVLYGCVGSLSTMVFVNSTWTYNHIASLWKYAAYRKRIRILYPPCSLPSNDASKSKSSIPTNDDQRQPIILSIGQFRPEKDHTLQIEAMAQYLRKHHPTSLENDNNIGSSAASNDKRIYPQLVLIGGCRNDADQQRLEALQQLCRTLQISKHVQFVVNEPFAVVQQYLYQSTIGIHTVRGNVMFFLILAYRILNSIVSLHM
jgi:alpha-1,2-mannosyltransferase